MTQVALRCDTVAHELFQFFRLRKAALRFAVPDEYAVYLHLKDASGSGYQRDLAEFLTEGAEEFLGVPPGAQKPAALRAEVDLDAGAWHLFWLVRPCIDSERGHLFLLFVNSLLRP